ncbi:hypothetical protein DRO66_00300 [Candidatus Bathyarchaeota archaeon]|nr:MAG: hypothetical protein DRO66_00300 [Candidatus Bathyarchaeota archaeon]
MGKLQQVMVIRTVDGKEDTIGISARLAGNSQYMSSKNLRLAPKIKVFTPTSANNDYSSGGESRGAEQANLDNNEPTDIKEDTLSMSVEELASKYKKEDWIALARELKLQGNHKGTKEVNLIAKIKNKLEE